MLLIFSDWEQRKLEELAEFFNEKRIPIDSSKREVGKYPYYGATGIIDYVKNYIFDGEFVLLAEDGANITMRNSPIAYLTKGKFWLNNHAHILKMKKGSNKFLLQMLENQNYEKFNSGTAQPKLNAQVVKEMRFFFPREQEQIKIGIFFKRLDDTIALHQDKLEKLKQLKKGYLQFMFPQNGEKVPRLRFANFSADWEQCKLGDVTQVTMGQSPSSENYTDNPEDYILVQGNADMKDGRVTPRVWTTQITKLAEENDLILSVRAPVGDIGKTDYKAVLGRGVAGIKGDEFIFQLLGKMKQEKFWTKLSTGSTFESINSKDIQEAMLVMPNRIEQKTIGELFLTLDNTIALRQKKILILQEIKKIYLQKMFA